MSDEIVKQSIMKMIDLNMKDEDIVGSLMDAGLDYEYAKEMLDLVKYKKEPAKPNTIPKEDISDDQEDDDELDDTQSDQNLGVWQRGVITLIDQKLTDIATKQANMDKSIETKVQSITENEIKKLKVIMDSQRTLLISRITTELETKSSQLSQNINNSLKTVQDINKQTITSLEEIKSYRDRLKSLENSIIEQISELSKFKDSANSIIEQSRKEFAAKADELLKNYENKFVDIDKKLNSALSLSSKIIEGLVSATKQKLDNYYDTKFEDYMKNKKDSNVQSSNQDLISRIEKLENRPTPSPAVQPDTKSYDDSIADLNRRFMELNKKVMSESSPKDIKDKIEELTTFKEQYASLVSKIQKDIKELKGKK